MQPKTPVQPDVTLDPAAASDAHHDAATGKEEEAVRPRFPIAGIGASAGGLSALEALTKQLHADGMSFIAVQHLAPGHDSSLVELLARCTHLPVATVQDGMPIEINRIYVAQPTLRSIAACCA